MLVVHYHPCSPLITRKSRAIAALCHSPCYAINNPGEGQGGGPCWTAADTALLPGITTMAPTTTDMTTTVMATTDMATTDMATTDMATTDMATTDMATTDMATATHAAINFTTGTHMEKYYSLL